MSFKPRTTEPSTVDKHWIHTTKGGLNSCILIKGNSCIPNCVGYAWGRAYEILGSAPKLSRMNAEDWYGCADGYSRSKTPSLGAIICWSKGKVGVSSDGAGHVAVVEEIKSNGDIVTSNSGYNSKRFWMQTFTKASGYKMSGYDFQGFIHILGAPSPSSSVSSSTSTSNTKTVESAKSKDNSLRGTYTVTASDGLNMRTILGNLTDATVIVLLPKGTRVQNYGYYTQVGNTKWLYCQATYKNVTYTGFCSMLYLKKN